MGASTTEAKSVSRPPRRPAPEPSQTTAAEQLTPDAIASYLAAHGWRRAERTPRYTLWKHPRVDPDGAALVELLLPAQLGSNDLWRVASVIARVEGRAEPVSQVLHALAGGTGPAAPITDPTQVAAIDRHQVVDYLTTNGWRQTQQAENASLWQHPDRDPTAEALWLPDSSSGASWPHDLYMLADLVARHEQRPSPWSAVLADIAASTTEPEPSHPAAAADPAEDVATLLADTRRDQVIGYLSAHGWQPVQDNEDSTLWSHPDADEQAWVRLPDRDGTPEWQTGLHTLALAVADHEQRPRPADRLLQEMSGHGELHWFTDDDCAAISRRQLTAYLTSHGWTECVRAGSVRGWRHASFSAQMPTLWIPISDRAGYWSRQLYQVATKIAEFEQRPTALGQLLTDLREVSPSASATGAAEDAAAGMPTDLAALRAGAVRSVLLGECDLEEATRRYLAAAYPDERSVNLLDESVHLASEVTHARSAALGEDWYGWAERVEDLRDVDLEHWQAQAIAFAEITGQHSPLQDQYATVLSQPARRSVTPDDPEAPDVPVAPDDRGVPDIEDTSPPANPETSVEDNPVSDDLVHQVVLGALLPIHAANQHHADAPAQDIASTVRRIEAAAEQVRARLLGERKPAWRRRFTELVTAGTSATAAASVAFREVLELPQPGPTSVASLDYSRSVHALVLAIGEGMVARTINGTWRYGISTASERVLQRDLTRMISVGVTEIDLGAPTPGPVRGFVLRLTAAGHALREQWAPWQDNVPALTDPVLRAERHVALTADATRERQRVLEYLASRGWRQVESSEDNRLARYARSDLPDQPVAVPQIVDAESWPWDLDAVIARVTVVEGYEGGQQVLREITDTPGWAGTGMPMWAGLDTVEPVDIHRYLVDRGWVKVREDSQLLWTHPSRPDLRVRVPEDIEHPDWRDQVVAVVTTIAEVGGRDGEWWARRDILCPPAITGLRAPDENVTALLAQVAAGQLSVEDFAETYLGSVPEDSWGGQIYDSRSLRVEIRLAADLLDRQEILESAQSAEPEGTSRQPDAPSQSTTPHPDDGALTDHHVPVPAVPAVVEPDPAAVLPPSSPNQTDAALGETDTDQVLPLDIERATPSPARPSPDQDPVPAPAETPAARHDADPPGSPSQPLTSPASSVSPAAPAAPPDPPAAPATEDAAALRTTDVAPGEPTTPARFRPQSQDDLAPSGEVRRTRANLAALRTLRTIQQEQRPATSDEQAVLARWSGWGALAAVFDHDKPNLAWAREELRELMSREEVAAAARNMLTAHYTDFSLVRPIWSALEQLGFSGGRILEPGCGAGNFLALAPENTHGVGIELDPTTAAIAAALHPHAQVLAESFADTVLPAGVIDLTVGNVPYGDVHLTDPVHNPGREHAIHNHFILKSLALTKPGGLVAVITSRYTMDATEIAARRDMAALADLVGAVRLPSGAHQRAAGTGVLSDLLILRRREPDRAPADTAWEQTRPIEIDGQTLSVNTYWLDHPDRVLGEHSLHGQYRADDLAVRHPDLARLPADLEQALCGIVADAQQAGLTFAPVAPAPAAPIALVGSTAARTREGFVAGVEGSTTRFTRIESGQRVDYRVSATQAREVTALLAIRDTIVALLEAEARSFEDTEQITGLRAQLNERYDNYVRRYGPIGRFSWRRTGRLDNETGEPKMAQYRPDAWKKFRVDPFAPAVLALEHFDPETQTATKADVFRKRVIAPRKPRLAADTPADAVAICLDTHGEVRLEEVARLLGCDLAEARDRLGTTVFDDPDTGRLVPAAEYLSGNVRVKLRTLFDSGVDQDSPLWGNVEALRAVVPRDLRPDEIHAKLGAAWLDAATVQQFFRETLRDPHLVVENPGGGIWAVNGNKTGVQATQVWGTEHAPAPAIARMLLDQRPILVYDRVDVPGGGERRILNGDKSALAQGKSEELAERFSEWVWEEPQRARRLARVYNEQFNGIVLRSYDDAELSLPGLAITFEPNPHQIAAVARMIHEPAVLLAHEVGAGKTAEIVMGLTELRRLGLVTKPCVVVPNHMLEQFSREWLQLYPQANLLLTTKDDFAGPKRREFVARCANGDWDAIVMTYGAFEKIALSPEQQEKYLDHEVDRMRKVLAKARESESGLTVRRMEGAIQRAEEALKKRLAKTKDLGYTFEQTGIDYIALDEAHSFKNLHVSSNIPGAAIDGSARASDMHAKLEYLREQRGKRIATFATATPIANSVTEAYVMQLYLRPDLLAEAEVDEFDVWAATFGDSVTSLELAPAGGEFRLKTRFAKYHNVPELLRMWWLFTDVKLAEDLNLPIPEQAERSDGKREPEIILAPATPTHEAINTHLLSRIEDIRSRAVDPRKDNMPLVTHDGRSAAGDPRLVDPARFDGMDLFTVADPELTGRGARALLAMWDAHRDPDTGIVGDVSMTEFEDMWTEVYGNQLLKVHQVADMMATDWVQARQHDYPGADGTGVDPVRGSLIVGFCDLGTPKPDRWNMYDEIRHLLVERTVPREQIRFVHEAASDQAKAQLFAACRAGQVGILLGSTGKMGTGVNAQRRMFALHHIDCAWRPADIHQRNGRMYRRGNQNRDMGRPVRERRYVTEKTTDGYMYQTVARKADTIHQLMAGTLDVRTIEELSDDALSFTEAKAIATGDPRVLEHARLQADLAKLDRLQRGHDRVQDNLDRSLREFEQMLPAQETERDELAVALAARTSTRGEDFAITVFGRRFTSRVEAGELLHARLVELLTGLRQTTRHLGEIGHLGGLPVTLEIYQLGNTDPEAQLSVGHPTNTTRINGPTVRQSKPGSIVVKLENTLDRLDRVHALAVDRAATTRSEIERAHEELGKPFVRAQELADLRIRFAELEADLAPEPESTAAEGGGSEGTAEASLSDGPGVTGSRGPRVSGQTAGTMPAAAPARTSPVGAPPVAQPDRSTPDPDGPEWTAAALRDQITSLHRDQAALRVFAQVTTAGGIEWSLLNKASGAATQDYSMMEIRLGSQIDTVLRTRAVSDPLLICGIDVHLEYRQRRVDGTLTDSVVLVMRLGEVSYEQDPPPGWTMTGDHRGGQHVLTMIGDTLELGDIRADGLDKKIQDVRDRLATLFPGQQDLTPRVGTGAPATAGSVDAEIHHVRQARVALRAIVASQQAQWTDDGTERDSAGSDTQALVSHHDGEMVTGSAEVMFRIRAHALGTYRDVRASPLLTWRGVPLRFEPAEDGSPVAVRAVLLAGGGRYEIPLPSVVGNPSGLLTAINAVIDNAEDGLNDTRRRLIDLVRQHAVLTHATQPMPDHAGTAPDTPRGGRAEADAPQTAPAPVEHSLPAAAAEPTGPPVVHVSREHGLVLSNLPAGVAVAGLLGEFRVSRDQPTTWEPVWDGAVRAAGTVGRAHDEDFLLRIAALLVRLDAAALTPRVQMLLDPAMPARARRTVTLISQSYQGDVTCTPVAADTGPVAAPVRAEAASGRVLVLIHSDQKGTILLGTDKADGMREMFRAARRRGLRPGGWDWSHRIPNGTPKNGAWYIPKTRNQPGTPATIERIVDSVKALHDAGFTVQVDIDRASLDPAGQAHLDRYAQRLGLPAASGGPVEAGSAATPQEAVSPDHQAGTGLDPDDADYSSVGYDNLDTADQRVQLM